MPSRFIFLQGLTEIDRLKMLKKSGVCMVICGGISDGFYKMISNTEISMIIGIAGEVNQVLTAFICNRLGESCFFMPGYKRPAE